MLMIISGAVVIAISFIKPQSFIYVLAALAVYCSMMGLSQTAGFGVVIKHWRKTTQLAVWMKATNEYFTITNKYYIRFSTVVVMSNTAKPYQ